MVYNNQERLGIHAVAKIFNNEFNWVFRDQPVNDFGIDALVEVTRLSLNFKKLLPIGKLIAVQIKSGKSYFKENMNDYFVFRGLKKHLDYWLNYSIPVILILYDKSADMAYWQIINHSTVISTEKSFKVHIPKKNLLNANNRETLVGISFFKDDYQYRLW